MANHLESFKGKRVLVTGHTGFKGTWLSIWLRQLGADVIGLSLDPKEKPNLYDLSGIAFDIKDHRGDIRDKEQVFQLFQEEQPEIVFHLAAQALVIDGYSDPLYTFETNTLGTAHVLEAIRQTDSVHTGVIITTDKVYENQEWTWGYRENDPLGGYDPYSASKGAAEIVAGSYLRSFFNPDEYDQHKKAIATARAGNVIGGGDWSANRIVPDCIRAFEKGEAVHLRNPGSTRPWQHVLEPLGGYLRLASSMMAQPTTFCGAWNFGPDHSSIRNVGQLVHELIRHMGKGNITQTDQAAGPHEAKALSLDISKALFRLDWQPRLDFETTVAWTADWYKSFQSTDIKKLCEQQINAYNSI